MPTPDEVVDRMLRMAQLTRPNDSTCIDLGAGDGKIAIAAAKKFGARCATGIEYNPEMAKHAQANAEKAGVTGRAQGGRPPGRHLRHRLHPGHRDHDVPAAALNLKLRPQILSMKPGTRVVSHSFTMDDWEADEIIQHRRPPRLLLAGAGQRDGQLVAGSRRREDRALLRAALPEDRGHRSRWAAPRMGGLRDARLRGFAHLAFAYVDNNGVRRDFTGRVNGPHGRLASATRRAAKAAGPRRRSKHGQGSCRAARAPVFFSPAGTNGSYEVPAILVVHRSFWCVNRRRRRACTLCLQPHSHDLLRFADAEFQVRRELAGRLVNMSRRRTAGAWTGRRSAPPVVGPAAEFDRVGGASDRR